MKCIHDGDDSSLDRNLFALQTIRISFSVKTLMMMPDNMRYPFKIRQWLQNHRTPTWMLFHNFPLFIRQPLRFHQDMISYFYRHHENEKPPLKYPFSYPSNQTLIFQPSSHQAGPHLPYALTYMDLSHKLRAQATSQSDNRSPALFSAFARFREAVPEEWFFSFPKGDSLLINPPDNVRF